MLHGRLDALSALSRTATAPLERAADHLSTDAPALAAAEIGINHNGDIALGARA